MGINTNYVQIPSKNNPQRTLEILNSHLIETNMHAKTKDSSFVRTGHLAYLCLEGKAKKKRKSQTIEATFETEQKPQLTFELKHFENSNWNNKSKILKIQTSVALTDWVLGLLL